MLYNVRTDMASESNVLKIYNGCDELSADDLELRRCEIHGIKAEELLVRTAKAADVLGKNSGRYTTLSLDKIIQRRENSFEDACFALAEVIRTTIAFEPASVLVAALGNPDITPDALGTLCASDIIVTQHLKKLQPELFSDFCSVSLVRTGVLGTTGIESASHIRVICDRLHPDAVIAVDALAGADPSRLCRSIQVTDAGISPGSGVGNNREALDRDFLSVPVISIGVPTVVDASAFSPDDENSGLFVTPRSIDTDVRSSARLIAYGINLALHRKLTISDVDMLIG